MSDEIFTEGKTYISSKRASENTGYAQDYIGQLARSGIIDARRIGGLWYVSVDSLIAYKKNADDYKPQIALGAQNRPQEEGSVVSFDGKDFISASRAAKITGYNQDYIGQLARKGAILSRQVGNRWYIDRDALVTHKTEKDRMLGAVQSASVGIPHALAPETPAVSSYKGSGPYLTYIREDGDLIPAIKPKTESDLSARNPNTAVSHERIVPIRVVHSARRHGDTSVKSFSPIRTSGKTILTATKVATMLTIVIVLSYGIVELKDSSTYVTNVTGSDSVIQSPYLANAYESIEWLLSRLEGLVTREIRYTR